MKYLVDANVLREPTKPTPDPRVVALVSSPRSERWHRPGISQRIRRLSVDGHEEVLLRTGEQPIDGPLVPWSRTPDEAIVPTIERAIDWLLACPQKDFFVPIDSEWTDAL